MGFGGISIWSLVLILVIVVLLFGTKRLKNVGGDLGGAIKSFKKAVNETDDKDAKKIADEADSVIEGKVKEKDKV
ncbi:MAG TPA: twin-arginine translocase TatA/TatE family subunit [Chromatiales bacterium]|nr:twin-arginine translocase TatA/TatE family subunit [Thiotrichales bacterium]HIP66959.1 twin-arginine translocase TatA/TatE family subunit [Chromatiales bacterium]